MSSATLQRLLRLPAALALLLAGCASVPPHAGENPADPWERANRQVFEFNDRFDRHLLAPVARGYAWAVPQGARNCISNVFYNVGEVGSFINAALQAEGHSMAVDAGRFAANTTVGLLGCFDVAQRWGLERNRQDFGLTLGKWGLEPGPYVVLPFLGPHSLRDAAGEIPDYFTDPVSYVKPAADGYYITAAHFVDRRAQLLDAGSMIDQASFDRYTFLRDAYLQQRRNRVYNGNPPPTLEEEDPGDSPAPTAPATAPATPPAAPPAPAPAAPERQ